MSGLNTKHIKSEDPVLPSPLPSEDDVGYSASSSSHHTPLATGGNGAGDSTPSGSTELTSWARALQDGRSQKDSLMSKVKDLREKNRRYKEQLDQWLTSRRQVHSQQKTLTVQLSDRDRLIASLQGIIEDQSATILQLEQRLYGTAASAGTPQESADSVVPHVPSSSTGGGGESGGSVTARLITLIESLHEDKAQLLSQLTDTQRQAEMCQSELSEKTTALQHFLTESESNKENNAQKANTVSSGCSTDTEKQVETLRAENQRLAAEVSSLHRFYTRHPSLSFSPQAETLRRAEEEKGEAQQQLLMCRALQQQQQLTWKGEESELKAHIDLLQADVQHTQQRCAALQDQLSTAHSEHRQTTQQLRELQVKWIALQAKDPDVVTKVVQVEVESEQLKGQVADLERQCRDWEQRCGERDRMVAQLNQQIQHANDEARRGEEERQLLRDSLMEEVEKERRDKERAVTDARQHLEARMCDLRVTHQQTRLTAARLQSSAEALRQEYRGLANRTQHFPHWVAELVDTTQKQVVQAIEQVSGENRSLVRKYHKEMRLRKKYHNELVELKGNIRVLCRVRPPIKEDGTGAQADVVVTYDPDDDGLVYVTNKGRVQSFEFDRVFSPSSAQTEVFDEVKALVTSCIDGFNVCIFAYGQTGSGKTFTMEGEERDPGINQQALQLLFTETGEKGQDWQFTIQVSVLEIYNETIRDLLNSDSGNKLDVKMKGEGGGLHVPGLVTKVVSSLQEVNQVFAEGRKNRATATTNMNEHSSRSHCLLCVTVCGVNPTTNSRSFGRLNLVDLAGSERVSKSGTDGARLKEAQNINKSLASLGDVIHALRVKQSHIPFRNSKLTYLLQDSLEGDSKTLMIVQVSPVEKNVSETTYTLGFGQRVRTVELGPAKRALDTVDCETRLPASPLSAVGSPPAKRRHLSPTRTTPLLSSQPRFTPTPNKSSPTSSRLLRHNSRK